MGLPGPDVVAPDDFSWAIEIKDAKTIRLKHIWKPNKKLQDFWSQAKLQAQQAKKTPLLVVKIEGIWFCWEEVPADIYFHDHKQLFEDWCENHKP